MKPLKEIIIKNFVTESGRQGIAVLQQLLLVPLFISFWNVDTYADWIVISVIPTYLLLANFGLVTYGGNLVCIEYNKNKKNEVNFIYKNVFFFVSVLILSSLAIFLFFDYLFNFTHILKISSLSQTSIWIVVILLVLKYLFYTYTLFLLQLLKAIRKYHIMNLVIISTNLTELILIITILFRGGRILDVAFVGVLNHFIAFIFSYLFLKKRFRWFKTKKTRISLLYFKKIFYPSISFMIPNLSNAIIIQGTIIFIATSLNNNLLVFYNSMRIVLNGIRQAINTYSSAHCPDLLIFFAKRNYKKVVEIYRNLLTHSSLISITAVIILIFFIKEPFLLWTKGVIEWEINFFLIFLFASLLNWLNLPTIILPYTINKHTGLNKIHLLNFIVYWIVLLFLFDTFGLYAVPSALLFSSLYFLMHNFIYTRNMFKKYL